ncbi:hypothetical protein CTA1_5489 [Colletotrichum tanaceti]|uniref:Uncharacterized protein n=1 Tax=Colletotrichum tanaceti TaxID=1306861 RepID=A0A4U6XHX6_9PEZI|nr:hypothetical protein CTA1_5489 [Colletotrichum tanaceti]
MTWSDSRPQQPIQSQQAAAAFVFLTGKGGKQSHTSLGNGSLINNNKERRRAMTVRRLNRTDPRVLPPLQTLTIKLFCHSFTTKLLDPYVQPVQQTPPPPFLQDRHAHPRRPTLPGHRGPLYALEPERVGGLRRHRPQRHESVGPRHHRARRPGQPVPRVHRQLPRHPGLRDARRRRVRLPEDRQQLALPRPVGLRHHHPRDPLRRRQEVHLQPQGHHLAARQRRRAVRLELGVQFPASRRGAHRRHGREGRHAHFRVRADAARPRAERHGAARPDQHQEDQHHDPQVSNYLGAGCRRLLRTRTDDTS